MRFLSKKEMNCPHKLVPEKKYKETLKIYNEVRKRATLAKNNPRVILRKKATELPR
jgi:hypothetical protein